MIHADHDFGVLGQRREPSDLSRGDDLVGDQDVPYAALDHDLGLAQSLAADADGTSGDLVTRDDGALVGLGVGTQPHRSALQRFDHPVEVPLVGVEVNQEGRSLDLLDGDRDPGRRDTHRAGTPHGDSAGHLGPGAERARPARPAAVDQRLRCRDSNVGSPVRGIGSRSESRSRTRRPPRGHAPGRNARDGSRAG